MIVEAGDVVLDNNKPAIKFDGVDDYFTLGGTDDAGMLGDISVFSVNKALASGDTVVATGLTNSSIESVMQWSIRTGSANKYLSDISDGTNRAVPDVTASNFGNQCLITLTNDESGNVTLFADGTSGTPISSVSPMNDANYALEVGRDPCRSGLYFSGTQQELILFASDQSGNRTGIESNIATHYGITL